MVRAVDVRDLCLDPSQVLHVLLGCIILALGVYQLGAEAARNAIPRA